MTYVDADAKAPLRASFDEARVVDEKMPGEVLRSSSTDAAAADAAEMEQIIALPVTGQGTVEFALAERVRFTVTFVGQAPGTSGIRWIVEEGQARLEQQDSRFAWQPVGEPFKGAGVDPDPACTYWFSVDCHNRAVRLGIGEMRLGTQRAAYVFPEEAAGPTSFARLASLDRAIVDGPVRSGSGIVWRDPVTIDPPMRVLPHDAVTMEDIARGRYTVPGSLTAAGRQLYDNVAGAAFVLDTPDFPDFSAAIKASILDPNGWCHGVLKRKADEFGKHDETMTYLRITLGINQGESPGIPFVMEIWPSSHCSPIHNHGGADAVIRVLHGEITVNLYALLSPMHVEPFAVKTFVKDEVTWISARLNQVHKLRNLAAEPCITIQCYQYPDENWTHWPFFDYLEEGGVGHFDPNSDADFLTFKALMQEEWARR